jgi:hypothetical protein
MKICRFNQGSGVRGQGSGIKSEKYPPSLKLRRTKEVRREKMGRISIISKLIEGYLLACSKQLIIYNI